VQKLRITEERLYEADTMPAVVAASIFGSQGASLLSLSIMVPTVKSGRRRDRGPCGPHAADQPRGVLSSVHIKTKVQS